LTGGSRERYAQKEDKIGFSSNVTTVLPLSSLLAGARATFLDSGESTFALLWTCRPPGWQDRRIIPVKFSELEPISKAR
jgi:hypothetical protein